MPGLVFLVATSQFENMLDSTSEFSLSFSHCTGLRKPLWVFLFASLFSVAYPTSSLFSQWLVLLNIARDLGTCLVIQESMHYLVNCYWKAEGSSLMPAYASYWLTDLRQSWFLFRLPSLPCFKNQTFEFSFPRPSSLPLQFKWRGCWTSE